MAVLLRAVEDRDDRLVSLEEDDSVTIADRYELVGRVGHGATGSVYRAYDHTLDRHVAIKLLKPGELAVAEREAQVLAKISHRNVVTIHDFGQSAGRRYLVLELLEGRDFSEWLRQRPPPEEVIEYFLEAGRGLSAAHQIGLIHRDFKPSNVFLTDEGRVVVIDFGLARNLDSLGGEIEQHRFAEGTLAYMAPERLAGHEVDERSDQFSFCVALWEALAGTSPFVGADPLARYRSIRQGPAICAIDTPRFILNGLERGMSFERSQRFSTMDELLRQLERPAQPQRRGRHTRPALTAAAVAATFLFGWGFAPESPTIDDAKSSLDPRTDAAISILGSARQLAAAGDEPQALNKLMYATDLIRLADHSHAELCTFGAIVPTVGDLMVEHGAYNEARVAFAIAIVFAEDCDNISEDEVQARRESARGADWAKMSL